MANWLWSNIILPANDERLLPPSGYKPWIDGVILVACAVTLAITLWAVWPK